MNQAQFVNTKELLHYREILDGMQEYWGTEFMPDILRYCNIIPTDPQDVGKFWSVYLATHAGRKVGITGIYTARRVSEHAWLDWTGILPKHRGFGYGKNLLEYVEHKAKLALYKKILVNLPALCNNSFYLKHGYEVLSTGAKYIAEYPEEKDYVSECDIIIFKELK